MFEEFIRLCLNGDVNLATEHNFLKRPPRIQRKGNRIMSNHDDLLMSSMLKSQEFRKRREMLYQAESEDTIKCLGYCDYSRYETQNDGTDDVTVHHKLHPKSRSSQSLSKLSEEIDSRFSSLEDSKTLHGSRTLSTRGHSQNVSGTFESRLEQQQALQRQQMIAFLSAIHFESLQQTQEKTSKPEGLSSKSKLCKMLESLFNSFHLKTIRSRILR
ncbi:hypothetical protein BKA69DRAFT_665954 [Paraphysoderma sedebokerense]|nr:hypothetical protein BKA69DRAFT_665954 [Paraphysoderma sedebokerense]